MYALRHATETIVLLVFGLLCGTAIANDGQSTDGAEPSSQVVAAAAPARANVESTEAAESPAQAASSVQPSGEPAATTPSPAPESALSAASTDVKPEEPTAGVLPEEPWDYSPYRVRVWIVTDDESVNASHISIPLFEFLDRPFSALWKLTIVDAPTAVRAGVERDFSAITYESITSADPVIAVKRDHPDAPRIRSVKDVAQYVKTLSGTADRIGEVTRRGKANGNPTLDGIDKIFTPFKGDSLAVGESWKEKEVEALLLSRGMAAKLANPLAKIIPLPIDDLVMEDVQNHDKIFIVKVTSKSRPLKVEVVELDCLMQQFSSVLVVDATSVTSLPMVIGKAIIRSFAPIVRIEDAGQKTAVGLVRASGLATDPESPALIKMGEFLQPVIRKDDRNGNPIMLGPIPWAYLHVKKIDGARLEMDLYAGSVGGLQGRKNSRTFRMALRTRPVFERSVIRLHSKGNPNEPLIGYDIYQKRLDSADMTMIGRTDWDGRITIEKSEDPMRLLYVKNGAAVLARLPIVPGLTQLEVADLVGDDQRLRAEAFIRGTQNSIIDLIAIRTLLAARIRSKLEKGELVEAKELLVALQAEPTYDSIANDMGKKVVQLKGRNPSEQKKIDSMFAQTREMLVNNINSKLIRDLENDVAATEANGGVYKKPPAPDKEGESDAATDKPAAVQPAATTPSPETSPAAPPAAPAAASST